MRTNENFCFVSKSFTHVADGDEYLVLSGQHSVLALRRRADDFQRDMVQVPDEYLFVNAVVLEHRTPPGLRQLAAGDAQSAQSNIRELTVTEFTRILLLEWEADPVDDDQQNRLRLAKAYRKSGWRRDLDMVCGT